nr:hypothetical protein BaRGS_020698 [Batillaria attramentaria]
MSQWDTIRLNKASPRTEFVYNIDRLSNMAAIRMGDYKLLQGSTGGHNGWYPVPGVDDVHVEENDYKPPNNTNQLFNVKDDPEERRDLTESAPDVLDKMTKRLEEWRATGKTMDKMETRRQKGMAVDMIEAQPGLIFSLLEL